MPQSDPRQPRRPQRPPTAKRTPGPIRQRSECWPAHMQPTGWESEAAQREPAQPTPNPAPNSNTAASQNPALNPAANSNPAAQNPPASKPNPQPANQPPAQPAPTQRRAQAAAAHATPARPAAAPGTLQQPALQEPLVSEATHPRAPSQVSPLTLRREDDPTGPIPSPEATATKQGADQAIPPVSSPTKGANNLSAPTGDEATSRQAKTKRATKPDPAAKSAGTDHTGRFTIRDRQRPRIVSLDVARGVMLMVSVLSASLVTTPLPQAFTHAPWFGVHFLDLVFPVFVTMSGVGFAFAYSRRVRPVVVLRRAVVLILLGLGYTALTTQTYSLASLRFTGVLQLYGMLALFQGLLHWKLRSWKPWFRWTTLLTILLSALHVAWPPVVCELGGLTQTCNPSLYVDVNLFGTAHIYQNGLAGHDPEGIIAILGALLSMSAGTTLGHLLLQARRTGQRPLQAISFLLMYCAALGAGLSFLIEPFKRLWTPSFALLACIPALAIIVLFWLMLDRPDADATPAVPIYLKPLVSLGKNSLFVYFGSHLFIALALQGGTDKSPAWPVTLAEQIGWTPWGFAILCVLAWTLLATVLDHFKIYIRA